LAAARDIVDVLVSTQDSDAVAELTTGPKAAGQPILAATRRAIDGLRARRAPALLARTCLDLGVLVRDQGRADDATPFLDEARALFVDLQATPWMQRTDAVLTRDGVPAP
jgi:hypothetical protein